MGDDARDQCIYKFVGRDPGSLEHGVLYVANLQANKWEPLVLTNPKLKSRFSDQLDLLIRTREAAAMVGGSPCDRPEDIEVDPQTGAVIVALTNNESRGNLHGSLLRILERGADPLSLEFSHSTFMAGGPGRGFSCPDNLAFDPRGNLWMTSDMSSSRMGRGEHSEFGNNGLFWIPMSGPDAGKTFQVAHAPMDAEFTGPCFSPDGRTLFLSVQHPGESSETADKPTSRWPNGGADIPRSSVVAISGPALDALMQPG
jgi:secreted PhoX family phosphatase